MPKKKKEAPNVETNLTIGIKQEEQPKDDIIEPTDDLVDGDIENIDSKYIKEAKRMLFETSPNNKKTLVLNKKNKINNTPRELFKIKSNLTIQPLTRRYRGSKVRHSSKAGIRFILGGK